MSHLSVETLARLAGESGSTDEVRHLASCPDCRERLREFKNDVAGLADLPPVAVPPVIWPALDAALRAEGLIRPAGGAAGGSRPSRWIVAAAALLLFGAGVMTQRLWLQNGPPVDRRTETPIAASISEDEFARRLAAWETILLTTREAARSAPDDSALHAYERRATRARDDLLGAVRLVSDKKWY